ncbi:MAG: 2-vinyl bacteriochlorophyllide hydratase [Pseudomonadota bacterium]
MQSPPDTEVPFTASQRPQPPYARAGRRDTADTNAPAPVRRVSRPLYTAAERRRRDATIWTIVQGILAPLQFVVFLVSLVLVCRFLATGAGEQAAVLSIVLKTAILYVIMVTGAIWEKVVFGRYLLAPAFFWEDMVSFAVIALHTAYLAALLAGWGSAHAQMAIALAAYGLYAVNAAQFLLKLRRARLEGPAPNAATDAAPNATLGAAPSAAAFEGAG